MPRIDDTYLVAAGSRHGAEVISSADLDAKFGLREGWSEKYLGMSERHRLRDGEDIAPLAVSAVQDALKRARWSGHDVDLIVCGTTFVDQPVPSTAARIASEINPVATNFDVNAACAGFPYALTIASSLSLWNSEYQKIAVCMAENISPYIDHDDSESSIFFGDSAGVALLQREKSSQSFEVVAAEIANNSHEPGVVHVERGGYFGHNGRVAYQYVVEMSTLVGKRVLDLVGATGKDVHRFVGHQSSTRLLKDVADSIGVPDGQQWTNVAWAGNQSGAGSLTAFSAGWQEYGSELSDGDLVLVASVGAGFTSGAVLLRWCS